jgi:hypothetical protein
MMVREIERPSTRAVAVTVILPADRDTAEHLAERALGTVLRHIEHGVDVVLATTEAEGPLVRPVFDRLEAGRRLARAVASSGIPTSPQQQS